MLQIVNREKSMLIDRGGVGAHRAFARCTVGLLIRLPNVLKLHLLSSSSSSRLHPRTGERTVAILHFVRGGRPTTSLTLCSQHRAYKGRIISLRAAYKFNHVIALKTSSLPPPPPPCCAPPACSLLLLLHCKQSLRVKAPGYRYIIIHLYECTPCEW